MKIIKEDDEKHEFIAEDSRGYRFRFKVEGNRIPYMEECEDYNIHVKPKGYTVKS